ncbi:hypothetical protein ElyMa_004406900 [Elysia marginata]|uniref:Uncharacterized protein n=1 Tax=Elysia marginata TaxID=1093978 RepID=A0AAV4HAT5_9GAST|nr:hypothetical protein ElyMa_004406900 [Elysia marginata]
MPPVNTTLNGTLTGGVPDDFTPTPFPRSSMPAWAPSVAVALAMLIFLTASFYIRHRKVVKKRELLMDYFYIIFQYGGLRRKRMVAALCNTNAITLRELGRSFMISFDSVNNPENSCPFFLEDNSAFGASQNFAAANSAHKKTFFNRATLNSRKYRIPFRRNATANFSDENPASYPVSFHDILMKFKSKRPPPAPPGTPCMRPRSPSQFEMQGSSMCTIHGDDFDYEKYMEENEINSPVFYRRTRRNAYIPQPSARFADLVNEAKRHSLGSVYQEHVLNEGKRNSEPCELRGPSGTSGVFQVYGDHLSPGDASRTPRNLSEPTILVHSASSDWSNDGNGWTELPGPSGEGGVVFVRRLSRVDAQPGEYTYNHDSMPAPPLGLAKRANLSKVNVQSGNMTEYYNCLQRDTTVCQTPDKSPVNTSGENTPTREPGPWPPRRKRGRLSLGEIAVSNLNRRIDLTSESLKDYYPEVQERSKNRWARFKHVFSGSRLGSSKSSSIPSNHSSGKGKALVPPIAEERARKRAYHQQTSKTRWQKFVNAFTGFRSLPEQNSTQSQVQLPSGSRSYPAGLNMQQASSSCERSDTIELDMPDAGRGGLRLNIEPQSTVDWSGQDFGFTETIRPYRDASPRSPGVSSLREESSPARLGTRRFRSVFLAYKATRPSTFTGSKRYRKRYDSVTSSSQSLPYVSNLDIKTSPSRRVHEVSPLAREVKHTTDATLTDCQGTGEALSLERETSGLCSAPQEFPSLDEHSPCHDYSPRRALGVRDNLALRLDQSPRHCTGSGQVPQLPHGPNSQSNQTQKRSPGRDQTALTLSDFHSGYISHAQPFGSDSSSDSTDPALLTLLPEGQVSHHPPSTVPLTQHGANQNLLSPEGWQACTSVESIYYDTLSSPVSSPCPVRSSSQRHQDKVSGSHTKFNPSSPGRQSLRPRTVRHHLGDSDQRLDMKSNRLASPDWKPLRRRSEELRPHRRQEDKSPRRRSAASNMSSICSSLLASTEVVLVPMTISAPDSPVSSRCSSPSTDHRNHYINYLDSNPMHAAPSAQLSPSHYPKHAPIRLTVSCPNRSESDVSIDDGETTLYSSHGLRRTSDTLQVGSFSSSTPATPTRRLMACPAVRTFSPQLHKKNPPRSDLQGACAESRPTGSLTSDKEVKSEVNGARAPRLLRQTSQDVKTYPKLGYSSHWGK